MAMGEYCQPDFLSNHLSMVLQLFVGPYTVGRHPWTGDQPVARALPTHRTTQTQNKRTQTFMPRVAFEHTISMLERAKTVHAIDRAATMISFSFKLVLLKASDGLKVYGSSICPVHTRLGSVHSVIYYRKLSWIRST
jgi:hypothetical protein